MSKLNSTNKKSTKSGRIQNFHNKMLRWPDLKPPIEWVSASIMFHNMLSFLKTDRKTVACLLKSSCYMNEAIKSRKGVLSGIHHVSC